MTTEAILEVATAELKQLGAPKLWMTARALSRRIRKKYPELQSLSQVSLFDVLSTHAASTERPRKIRNSPYPSKNTLEVLWGAIDGDQLRERHDVNPPTMRADGAGPNPEKMVATALNPLEDEVNEELDWPPSLFLSYNFQDTEAARNIVDAIERKGHSVWMAGAQIVDGEVINNQVINAMKHAGGHLLYLSANALKSLWVGKEVIVGETMNLPRTIVVNGGDADLMGLVRHWIGGGRSSTFGKIEEYRGVSYQAARQFQDLLKEHLRCESNKIYLFPDAPDEEHVNKTRMLSLTEFPDADTQN